MNSLCDTCMHRSMNDCPYESDYEDRCPYPHNTDNNKDNTNLIKSEMECPDIIDPSAMCPFTMNYRDPYSIYPDMMDSEINNPGVMMPNMKTVDMSEDFGTDEVDNSMDNTRAPINEDEIFNRIERHNPEIIRNLIRLGIPYTSARRIVRRIIYLTLYYSKR